MSTLKCNNLQNTAGTKTVPMNTVVDGSAKAWVNFSGTGTVAIRSAFNVSSITDNGTGDYTLNFATEMPAADYAVQVTAIPKGSGQNILYGFGLHSTGTTAAPTLKSSTQVRVVAGAPSNLTGYTDCADVSVAIFR